MERLARLLPAPGPPRLLALSTLVASLGFGAFAAGSAVFFTQSVGVPTAAVGVALAVQGLAEMAASVPAGHLVDRLGPREAVVASGIVDAGLVASLLLVHSVPALVVAMAAIGLADAVGSVGRGALLAGLIAPDERVHVSAYLRSVLNVGITGGALLAGLAVAVDSRPAYVALVLWNAVLRLATVAVTLRLPHVPPVPAGEAGRLGALRDRPYLAVAVLCGLMRIDQAVLSIALPIWVVEHTDAPRVLAGWLLAVNTVLVVLFQVRASRGADTMGGARRLQRRAAVASAASCLVIGAAGSFAMWAAAAALVAGVAVLTAGELWQSAAEWAFRFDLADPSAQGRYGGVFELGGGVSGVLGPPLVTALTGALLLGGWVLLAALFAVLVAVGPAVVDRAVRTRPAAWQLPSA